MLLGQRFKIAMKRKNEEKNHRLLIQDAQDYELPYPILERIITVRKLNLPWDRQK